MINDRCITQISEHDSMIPTAAVRTMCKLSRAQWQRVRKSPGCPSPLMDGRTAKYRPDTLAHHLRNFNEMQQAKSLAQLHKILGISKATIRRWAQDPDFPAPLGKRHGLNIYSVEQVRAYQLKLTGGYKWEREQRPRKKRGPAS